MIQVTGIILDTKSQLKDRNNDTVADPALIIPFNLSVAKPASFT